VTHGGKHAGSWVHPRVAIRLAEWCSVKFSVATNGVIYRYMRGEVTTEESRALVQTIAARVTIPLDTSQTSIIVPARQPIQVSDMAMHDNIYDIGIPGAVMAPHIIYLLCIGIIAGTIYFKWGLTQAMTGRMPDHYRDFPNCKIVFMIDCGAYAPEGVESTVKRFVRRRAVKVLTYDAAGKPHTHVECFTCDLGEEREYTEAIITHVKGIHSDIIRSINFGGHVEKTGETLCITDRADREHALLMVREDTSCVREREETVRVQVREQEETARVREQEETARVQERTKQMKLEYKMLKLRSRSAI
jgi:hypothetical protein